jgi:hypothetical protein
MSILQRAKEGIVVQPYSMLLGKSFKRAAKLGIGSTLVTRERLVQQSVFQFMSGGEINFSTRQRRSVSEVTLSN